MNKSRLTPRLFAAYAVLSMGLAHADDPQAFGNWTLTTAEDPDSYETMVSIQQDSATSIKDEYATKDVLPQIAFRCRPGDPAIRARINWGRFISSFNTEVGFKVDDGKRVWIKWGVDRSEKMTVSPSVEDSRKLIANFSGGTVLDVEVSPYSEGPVTATYDLTAFDEAIKTLQASCE